MKAFPGHVLELGGTRATTGISAVTRAMMTWPPPAIQNMSKPRKASSEASLVRQQRMAWNHSWQRQPVGWRPQGKLLRRHGFVV